MYGGRCAICGDPVSKKKMTISHKVPLSKGGTNGISNLMLACWDCNQMQHSLDMEEFFSVLKKIYIFNRGRIEQGE